MATSPGQHDSPEHDDMVVKADGAARSVNAVQLAPGSLREVLPAGATRKLLREPNR
jgi:hypothetical protein